MDNGWVKIHRKITEWPFWFSEPFSRAQAWIDLILLTNHKQRTVFIRGNEITIERGQTISSIRFLASRWQWGINKTQKFLKNLEKNRQITRRGIHRICTYTTILNYEKYQSEDTQIDTQTDTQTVHRRIRNKNVKNVKNREITKEFINELIVDNRFRLVNVEDEYEKFEDYKKSTGRRYKDNRAAFRNWLRKAVSFVVEKNPDKLLIKKKNNDPLLKYTRLDGVPVSD